MSLAEPQCDTKMEELCDRYANYKKHYEEAKSATLKARRKDKTQSLVDRDNWLWMMMVSATNLADEVCARRDVFNKATSQ